MISRPHISPLAHLPRSRPENLSTVSTSSLNALSDRLYRTLDVPEPDPEALDQYYDLVEELAVRSASRHHRPC
jgi:hypothetical protein